MTTTTVDTVPFGEHPWEQWPTEEEMAAFEAAEGPIIATPSGLTVVAHMCTTVIWGTSDEGKAWLALQAAVEAARSGGRVVIINPNDEQPTPKRELVQLQRILTALEPDRGVWRDSIRVPASTLNTDSRGHVIKWLKAADNPLHSLIVQSASPSEADFLTWNSEHVDSWVAAEGGMLVVICGAPAGQWAPLGPASGFYDTELTVDVWEGQSEWTNTEAGEVTVRVLKDRDSHTGKREGDHIAVLVGAPTEDGLPKVTIKDPPLVGRA